MIEIIAILLVGIAFGRLFRRTSAASGIANRMNITVWILIFALGLSIGCDSALVRQIPHIGAEAGVLAALATAGSIITVMAVVKVTHRKS